MTAPARLGFDARMLGASGIGRYIEGLLPELVRQGSSFEWVVFARPETAHYAQSLAPAARILLSQAAYYRMAEQTHLLGMMLGARLDLLHAPHYNLPMAYPGALVVTIHDLIPLVYPEIHSGWLPRAYNRLLLRVAVRRARAIITPSQSTAHDLKARMRPRCPIYPIAEGVGARWFANGAGHQDASELRALGIHMPYFLYVGQWKPYRNIPAVIRALPLVRQHVPNAQLVVAGRRDPRHLEIPALVRRLGLDEAVRFPGMVTDETLQALYRNATAVLLPSYQEGFGLPVLEGMASGAPVICSDIPVLRETGGDAAARCAPDEEMSFAREMLRVMDPQERARRAAAGRKHAAAFQWTTTGARTLEVYREALETAP